MQKNMISMNKKESRTLFTYTFTDCVGLTQAHPNKQQFNLIYNVHVSSGVHRSNFTLKL